MSVKKEETQRWFMILRASASSSPSCTRFQCISNAQFSHKSRINVSEGVNTNLWSIGALVIHEIAPGEINECVLFETRCCQLSKRFRNFSIIKRNLCILRVCFSRSARCNLYEWNTWLRAQKQVKWFRRTTHVLKCQTNRNICVSYLY